MTDISTYLNQIICGDCLSVMRDLPDQSVDLFVTSPPYNLKNSTGNGLSSSTNSGKWVSAAIKSGYTTYDDNMPYDQYVAWQRECLSEMFRLLKNDGAIFYNHKWRVQNGLLQDRHEIVAGFPVRQIIIWRRKGGINFNPYYFLPTYEVIYLIAKPDFRLAPKANAKGDVWEFTQEMLKNGHPAPFPVDLITQIIGSTQAQIVFDPFMGSGTTAVAALELGRTYIGTDISPEYCLLAEKRIETYRAAHALKQPQKEKFTRESLIEKLHEIAAQGWIPASRKEQNNEGSQNKCGEIGNLLEDLLGIKENNIPLADAGEWEIKTQRKNTNSLCTLLHIEPDPRNVKFIPRIFLKYYSWPHQDAGTIYPATERSFRQTLRGKFTDRGFRLLCDGVNRRLKISFDASKVSSKHKEWLEEVNRKIGLDEMNPQPYWDYDELKKRLNDKMKNCIYVQPTIKKSDGALYVHYDEIYLLENFSIEKFVAELEAGEKVYIDIDARTGHNHGTKIRMKSKYLMDFYEKTTRIV